MVKERVGMKEALEIEPDEEMNSLIQEVAGEDSAYSSSKGKNGPSQNTRTIIIKDESGAGSSRIWKVLAFILFGIVLLFATDSIEIKHTNKGEFKAGEVEEREDVTDNPLLHYTVIKGEEAGIDVKGEAAGESMADNMNFTTTAIAPSQEMVHNEEPLETSTKAPDAKDGDTADAGEKDEDVTDGQDARTETLETVVEAAPPSPRRSYWRRGQPLGDAAQKQMTDQWGKWDLVDPKLDQRPKHDFYAAYPNRDIPRTEFPSNAWQLDQAYVGSFLAQGIALAERALEGILSEYGHGKEDLPGVDFQERSKWIDFDLIDGNLTQFKFPRAYDNGGWTTPRSWTNLKKRVLHSIMTQDSFIFAMGGHSASAGHGNHFRQSYSLQVAWIMEPIFARLGVLHESRNFGNGGLGTAHNSIAAGSTYGPDVDLLMWDSGMTEGRDSHILDMFARQGIMGGIKVPAVWNLSPWTMAPLHDFASADVGAFGSAKNGIPVPNTLEELDKVKWAAKYIFCGNDINNDKCKPNRYNATCWLDRPDGFKPWTKQDIYPGGRAGWHPGNKEHQLTGRIITFLLLKAIREALTEWKTADNFELPDSSWHVTEVYEAARKGVEALDPRTTDCKKFVELNMGYFCTVPFKARTEFTPRAYAGRTNIRTIMPKQMLQNLPPLSYSIYEPPDVFNPYMHPPPGEVDLLNIVENGPGFVAVMYIPYAEQFYHSATTIATTFQKPGKGVYPHLITGADRCDGTMYSWCNRGGDNPCLLSGHNDQRTGFIFDSFSGWVIVNVPKVKRGYVVIKIESWHYPNENPLSNGWNAIDGEESSGRQLGSTHASAGDSRIKPHNTTAFHFDRASPYSVTKTRNDTTSSTRHRQLKPQPAAYCPEFRFEYAIDDRPVKSLPFDDFEKIRFQMQRVVETITLLEEPDTWKEERDVQLAIRITGCARTKVFNLNHVYWS